MVLLLAYCDLQRIVDESNRRETVEDLSEELPFYRYRKIAVGDPCLPSTRSQLFITWSMYHHPFSFTQTCEAVFYFY